MGRLIDADNLIDYFYRFFKGYEGQWDDGQPQYWADNMAECVHAQPTVDAEPVKHGHWQDVEGRIICLKCSACGDWFDLDDSDQEEEYKYCPLCGAKMDEPSQTRHALDTALYKQAKEEGRDHWTTIDGKTYELKREVEE